MKKGLIHVYTGNGKGKTTSAVGLCIRAKSRGLRVLFAQFMKKDSKGEVALMEELSIKVMQFKKVLSPHFHPDANIDSIRQESIKALDALGSITGEFDLMVLDEFTHLLSNKLVAKKEALRFITDRPPSLELVFTGRGAPEWLIDLADYVTEMKDVKHPSKNGLTARKGIEH
jgi:cob(I)alamin adenosyltransferase